MAYRGRERRLREPRLRADRLPGRGAVHGGRGGSLDACEHRRTGDRRRPGADARHLCSSGPALGRGRRLAGQAIEGDREPMRDLYAAAAQRWVDEGRHDRLRPLPRPELVDAWFRLSFGGQLVSGHARDRPGGAVRRPTSRSGTGRPTTTSEAARLELEMAARCVPSPSFSDVGLQTFEEVLAEWREDDNGEFELFVAERAGRVVGQFLLYRRPPDLRVPRERHRPRAGLDRAGGARHRRRPRADRARDPLGPRARLPGDDDRLADDEPLGLALLAEARLSPVVPAALPLDPVVQRVPLLFGTRLTVVDVPDEAVVLRPPPPGEPVADVRAAVRDALALPARGRPARGARDARRPRDDRGRAAGAAAAGRAERPAAGRPRRRLGRARAGRHPDRAADAARLHGPDAPAAAARARAARRRLARLRPALPRHGRDPGRREPGPGRAGAGRAHAAGRPPRARGHRPGADRQRRRDGARRRAVAAARLRRRRGAAGGDRVLAARDRRLAGLAAGDAARAPAHRPPARDRASRSCSTSRACGGAARGYPYEPEAVERIARSPLGARLRAAPGLRAQPGDPLGAPRAERNRRVRRAARGRARRGAAARGRGALGDARRAARRDRDRDPAHDPAPAARAAEPAAGRLPRRSGSRCGSGARRSRSSRAGR